MSDETEEMVNLNIQNNTIKCKKNDLIEHSDYFKVMFEGNFVERDQKQINIEGIDLRAMNIILMLIWDETYSITENEILTVLQAACMLQFDRIKSICLERLNEMLRLDNCIKIWVVTEQLSLKPIYLKAKLMALQEFMQVHESESILDLSLDYILDYLGNIYLKSDNQLTIFQAGMKWWYEHSEYFNGESTETLLKLLSCIDFNNLDNSGFSEIMLYPDISGDDNIIKILQTVKKLRNKELITDISDIIHHKAQLLYNSKPRISPCYAAILVNMVPLHCGEGKKSAASCDKFKRKRILLNIISSRPEKLTAVYYDADTQRFKDVFIIDKNKCENLEGFKIIGYKELTFLYGGQHLIGKGEWNVNFWVYDSIREKWERKSTLPHCRRHFESCIVGNKVVIAGGIGNFRIIQDNTFFYDYKRNFWSPLQSLPQMKCCSFLDKCFFFSIVLKCGYFWEEKSLTPNVKIDLIVKEEILKNQSEYAIFSHGEKFYIKGKDLIEMKMENNKLVMISVIPVTNLDCDKMELTVCNNIVYTFYKSKNEDGTTKYSLETLNLETNEFDFIFKDLSENSEIGECQDEKLLLNSKLKIFTITHYSLLEKNTVINDSFRNFINK